MRRRALLSGLLLGGLAVLSGALTVRPVLEAPLEPEDGEGEGEEELPPSIEPLPPSGPPPLEPEEEEPEPPPTEPA